MNYSDMKEKKTKPQSFQTKKANGDKNLSAASDSRFIPAVQPEGRSLVVYDPLQMYLLEIKKFNLLTREEEKELGIRIREKKDEKAAYRLITSNLRLVVKIAMDFHRAWTKNLLDLIQEGNLGLLQAVRKFDPYLNIKFSYYASFWIKAYMLKFIMDNWKLVKVGTTQAQRKLFFNLSKERDKLASEGFSPEPRLLAERLDVKEDEIVEMSQRLGGWELSLDSPVNEDSTESYSAVLPESEIGIDEQLFEKERQKLLGEKLKEFRKTLAGKEADIFDSRIMAYKPLTLQALGDKYSISRERIRQIQERIIKNVEKWLKNEIPNFEEEFSDFLK